MEVDDIAVGTDGAVARVEGTTAPPPATARGPRAAADVATRLPSAWNVAALGWALTAALGVHLAARRSLGPPIGQVPGVPLVASLVAAASAVLLVVLLTRDRPRLVEVPRRLVDLWQDPPGHWVAAVTGALVALPVISLYVPVLLNDADSARVVAAVRHTRRHGIGFLVDTQDNVLPHLVLGPVVALGGLAGAKAVAALSVVALGAVVGYVTWRITGSMFGTLAAALALVATPPVVDRAGYVPMYPTMLALGYLGAWLAFRAMTEPDRPWRRAAAAAVCLALAPEAHAVGLLFLAVPVLLVGAAPTLRRWSAACGRIYLVAALVSLPRLVLNVWEGGFSRLTSYRTDYWITKGYLEEIQTGFWGYQGVDEPLGEYLSRLPGRFFYTLELGGTIVFWLAVAAAPLACRRRGRLVALAGLGFMAVAVTVKQIPPFPRYYAPLWPGMAILVGVGGAALARRTGRLRAVARPVAALGTVGLAVLAWSSLGKVGERQLMQVRVVHLRPYHELAALIDDDRGVIGARSHALLNVSTRNPTWGGQFLTEDEYVTYLTWPSDEEVLEVLDRHDIGWVLIHANLDLELGYHDTWLLPHHGRPARHVARVAESPSFCRVAAIDGYQLYRVGGCTGDAGAGDGGGAPSSLTR